MFPWYQHPQNAKCYVSRIGGPRWGDNAPGGEDVDIPLKGVIGCRLSPMQMTGGLLRWGSFSMRGATYRAEAGVFWNSVGHGPANGAPLRAARSSASCTAPRRLRSLGFRVQGLGFRA